MQCAVQIAVAFRFHYFISDGNFPNVDQLFIARIKIQRFVYRWEFFDYARKGSTAFSMRGDFILSPAIIHQQPRPNSIETALGPISSHWRTRSPTRSTGASVRFP